MDDWLNEARRHPDRIPQILALLAASPDDQRAADVAIRVALADPAIALPTLIGWLADGRRAWAAACLADLIRDPDLDGLPMLDETMAETVVSTMQATGSEDLALVLLALGLATESARDVLVERVNGLLDESAFDEASGRWDYDLGCWLQIPVMALRNAPPSAPVVALLDRIFAHADGPLASVCATCLIRPGDAPEVTAMLSRWRTRIESLEFDIENYGAARVLEIDTALALARGESVASVVSELVAAYEPCPFVGFAVQTCVELLAEHARAATEGALTAALERIATPEHAAFVRALRLPLV